MKKLINTIYFALLNCICIMNCMACSSSGDDNGDAPVAFTISQTELAFDKAAGSQNIVVKGAKSVTVSSTEAWCTATASKYSDVTNAITVKVEVSDNAEAVERTASVTISANSERKTVTVTQKPGDSKAEETPDTPDNPDTPDPIVNPITANARELAKLMYPGWNLGNTLEGGNSAHLFTNNGGLGAETSWQSTKTSLAIIQYVKSLGFNSVRIPCAWAMGHISNAATYEIDKAWMDRVQEIVDYCVQSDMIVLLNDHWDGGWLENNIKDNNKKAENKKILAALWKQIAERFRDYDDHLLFAGLNEPNAENQTQTDNLIEFEQVFIDAVRATGGRNATRTLVVQGPTTNIDHTCNFYKQMPTDPAGDGHLMMEIHYYDPWQFWGMEADESWGKMFFYWGSGNHQSGSKHNPSWDCEESYMDKQLTLMQTNFVNKGIPVIIGEFGANWRNISSISGESQAKHDASIKTHYYTLYKLAKDKGMVPMVWDVNSCNQNGVKGNMTVINRTKLSVWNTNAMNGMTEGAKDGVWPY